jgi:FMN hydrolase / 5-amino-6-(5-phospho-D-ribitylamino)uracil phosphatase
MLEIARIQAITLDLDDTLWPIWPVIMRAEKALQAWLEAHAPMTAALFASPNALREIREYMHQVTLKKKPEMAHDLGAIRKESIRLALYRAGDNPLLAEDAFAAFMAERNRVAFYEDALPALQALSSRYPLASLSNGNAHLGAVGIAHYFAHAVNAVGVGAGKPDLKIFEAAAQALQVPREAVLHVGDDVSLDVLGALDAGMQAIWLNRQGKLWPHDDREPTLEVASLAELAALLCPA